jgi:hypothetical protein
MFHLPTPIKGQSGPPDSVINKKSRGQEYSFFRYHCHFEGTQNEPYSVLTDSTHSRVFAYMSPRQTKIMTDGQVDIENTFLQQGEYLNGDVIEAKDAIEGTMITFFWNPDANEWDICTRNGVGGDYAYGQSVLSNEQKPTFRQMVIDAFRMNPYTWNGAEYVENKYAELNDIETLGELSKSHCYTCILSHHHNHIVYELGAIPPLVFEDSSVRYSDCVRELSNPTHTMPYLDETKMDADDAIWNTAEWVFGKSTSNVKYLNTLDDVANFKKELFVIDNTEFPIQAMDLIEREGSLYYPPAWILTNLRTGHRTELPNPFYERAKMLRNMQPNIMYLYLTLRKNNTILEYLNAFPGYYEKFAELERIYIHFITEVHRAYVNYYILKIRDNSIPKKYFVHAARIHHNIYLPSISEERVKINWHVVNAYFSQFSVSKMLYIMETTD